jgi:hypothetical protein
MIAALEAIQIAAPTITLDPGVHAIYEWTRHAAPRQGFNCLAKHNTDREKEVQTWISRAHAPFAEPDNLPTTHPDIEDDSDNGDDPPICLTRPHPPPTSLTPTVLYPPASKFILTIDDVNYNYLPERLLREQHHLPLHQKFLKDNCDLALDQFDNVAWELAATIISELSIMRTLPVLKFTANEWSTGDKQQSHFHKSNKCPFCNEEETMKHVFTCNHPSSISF